MNLILPPDFEKRLRDLTKGNTIQVLRQLYHKSAHFYTCNQSKSNEGTLSLGMSVVCRLLTGRAGGKVQTSVRLINSWVDVTLAKASERNAFALCCRENWSESEHIAFL